MGTARWYPTAVELGSGNIFTVGGIDERGLRTKTSQTLQQHAPHLDRGQGPAGQRSTSCLMYPSLHLLSDGRVFYSGANVFGAGPAAPGIWNVNDQRLDAGGRPDRSRPPGPGR